MILTFEQTRAFIGFFLFYLSQYIRKRQRYVLLYKPTSILNEYNAIFKTQLSQRTVGKSCRSLQSLQIYSDCQGRRLGKTMFVLLRQCLYILNIQKKETHYRVHKSVVSNIIININR